jgi:hypothetical protein
MPARIATARPRLKPWAPAGWAVPIIRSSTLDGSTDGTLLRRSLTIWAAMSSGRIDTREPLLARPIGLRDVATMTASGTVAPCWG